MKNLKEIFEKEDARLEKMYSEQLELGNFVQAMELEIELQKNIIEYESACGL